MNKRWKLALILLLLVSALVVSACTPGLPRNPSGLPMTYEAAVDIRLHGFRRTYRVHLPPAYDTAQPLPLVVVIHGAFDTAAGMEAFSGFSKLADQENFIALYPNGMGLFGFLQHWNAGHCCGKAAADKLDDVGFLATVIEDACARLSIDRRRIYMVGFSNGGMMAYRFAAERGDLLAAVAPLAASIGGKPSSEEPIWTIPEPPKPLPLLTMHARKDAYVPFDGGRSPAHGGTREYLPVSAAMDFWVRRNGCRAAPVSRQAYQGQVRITTWDDCRDQADVVLYVLEDWEHVWPGPYFTANLAPDEPMYNFDAAAVIWDFFKNHSR